MQLEADKTYEATIRLGMKTTTGDAEGEVVLERAVPPITDAQLRSVSDRFTGNHRQVPPMHSALKKDGKPLYEYARCGQEVERDARDVVIHSLVLTAVDAMHVKLVAHVSKGTYIRTLGEDIGEALGCGGHLTSLRRIATGHFSVADTVTLPALEAMSEVERLARVKPVDVLLPDHMPVMLDSDNAGRFLSGLRRRGEWPDNENIAVYGLEPKALLGTAHTKAGELIPTRLLAPTEIQQILQTES